MIHFPRVEWENFSGCMMVLLYVTMNERFRFPLFKYVTLKELHIKLFKHMFIQLWIINEQLST
jgi:hypothetical protein